MKTRRRVALIAIACVLNVAARAADCDAKCLRDQLDTYVATLVKRDSRALKTATPVRYTENGKVLKLGEGLWAKASAVETYAHFFVDRVSQQALFYGTIREGDSPALVSLRLGMKDGKIAEIEHIVARKGSHALFAPEALPKPNPLFTAKVPAANRSTREQMIAITDSYFQGIEQHSSKIVKADENCQRIENGVQTTNQPGRASRNCQHSADLLTYIKSVDDRRFPIVDPETGVTFSVITFDIPGETSGANDASISSNAQLAARLREPRTLLLSEWFKIERGVITHIEAVMHNLPRGSKSGWEKGR